MKKHATVETASVDCVMMICPNLKCRKVLRVPSQYRGQLVKCHYCQITFEVPAATHKNEAPTAPTNPPQKKK